MCIRDRDNMEQEQYSASVKVEDTEEDRMMDAAQENSLMLVSGMVDDDMEHIADMKEQFSQTIDPILRMASLPQFHRLRSFHPNYVALFLLRLRNVAGDDGLRL